MYRTTMTCHNCKARRRFVVILQGWYGSRCICRACGAEYEEEYEYLPWKGMSGKPRRARMEKAAQQAKELYDAVTLTRHDAYRKDIKDTIGPWDDETETP
jgi:hypothetical protein